MLRFLQNLPLGKTQADALLHRLARQWSHEFEVLCTLLANSLVVHIGSACGRDELEHQQRVGVCCFSALKRETWSANGSTPKTFLGPRLAANLE
ncbi:MAG: hypothetical protein K2X38_07480 [Gemmataceae bacterium]|nr:hypothetical protein [Gemmataceae bacterium]